MSSSDRKKIVSWAMYDWANSSYSTTVMAGFFPIFFQKYWSQGADATVTTAKLGTALGLSGLATALICPSLGAIADLKGSKKFFTGFFMIVAVLCCVWMAFIPSGEWFQALFAYGLSMTAFAASAVFYDALLPSIASGHRMDYASSLGYALGYLGGGVLFALNVLLLVKPDWFGLPDGADGKTIAVKIGFASVAVWWVLFSLPLFRNVPEPHPPVTKDTVFALTLRSFSSLAKTFSHLREQPNLLMFMVAYWLYIDGVYTVMTMAVDFGAALGLDSSHLMAALLLVQFVGFPATFVFGLFTERTGCRVPILFCIGAYAIAVILATRMETALHFYMLALLVGLVQGGVQSLSRSLFGHMVPKDRSGEFYGFFNLVGKFASILGPFVVAATVTITGDSRRGLTGLIILFGVGGFLLWKVKEPVHSPTGGS